MIPYITFRETDSSGRLCYYILQKAHPHYKALLSVGKLEDTLASMPVLGYNLYLNFNGCLRGNVLPAYKDAIQEIEFVLDSMATWFYENRVLAEPKKYLKFKQNYSNDTNRI